jgi:hypothetical protein
VYLLIALALTVVVILLAWRGLGAHSWGESGEQPAQEPTEPRPRPRPVARRQVRITAPDDDPEFLREIDRKLRGEDKSS